MKYRSARIAYIMLNAIFNSMVCLLL